MLLACVSFDCHTVSPFLSNRRRMLLSRLCLLLPTPLALSLSTEGHSCFDNNTRSLSLLRRSLAQSVCSDVTVSLSRSPPPATRALRITLNFTPQNVGAAAGRPATCATVKGARADVDRTVLRAITAAATPPPISSSGALAS
jgi:hypothetical protein